MTFHSAIPFPFMMLLLFCQLLITGIVCYGQNVNTVAAHKAFMPSLNTGNEINIEKNSIQRIDSIALTSGTERHFCKIYSQTMGEVAVQMQKIDSGSRAFIEKFEIGFADYFLKAWADEKNNNLSDESGWKCFFSNPGAKPWQIVLLGVNAHTNIDIWQTLVYNFSKEEVMQYNKKMLSMQTSVTKVYQQLFRSMKAESGYLRFINTVTLGLAKKFGEEVIYKWRRRNVELAILYYHNKKRFTRKLAQVNRKKQKNDQRILRYGSSPFE